MTYKHNIIKERFDIKVTDPNQTIKETFELDSNAKYVKGILITSDRDELLFYRGSQRIALNDQELFPEEFESRLLMAGLNVSPDERTITLGNIETGNGRLEVWYKDADHSNTRFLEYRVSIYTFSITDLQIDSAE
jgi:hypothetical protein